MQSSRFIPAVLAFSMGLATLASAQPRDMRDGRDGRGGPPGQQQNWDRGGPPGHGPDRGDRGNRGRDMRYGGQDRSGPGAGPDHRFHRGDRLPPEYRNRQYVVDDWRGHRLSAPPRGYQWVQMGGDYVLAAIATGVIASLLLNH